MSVTVNGKPVEWDPAVLEELRVRAMAAFEAHSPVGGEIAGILYGRASNTRWRILNWRELKREDSSKPAVPLGPAELAQAQGMVTDWMSDLDLRSLKPIGWFRSRTRGMAALSPEDAEACAAIFGKKGALALILRPSTQRPVAASFIHYTPGEEHEVSQRGVQMDLLPWEQAAAAGDPAALAELRDSTAPAVEPVAPQADVATPAAPRSRFQRFVAALPRVAAFVVAVAAVTAGFYLFLDRPVRLDVEYDAAQVTLKWNPSVGFLTGATGAELQLNRVPVELPLDRLRSGRYSWPRPAGDLRLGFQLRGEYAAAQRGVATVVSAVPKK
ncbi:MAG: hypothetical protein NTZ56_20880 [Acidobacteria bacterium]|nr:hypothetical protein [Acidobacteriota bacterium]